jgi:hypothetical protein
MTNRFLFLLLSITTLGLTSCGDDIQDPLQGIPLKGEIEGQEWEYTVGKAFFSLANQSYQIELFNTPNVNDGCTVFGGNSAFVSFEIPTSEQTINQPSAIYQSLTFHFEDSQTAFTATTGYVEIILINNFEVRGIINSRFDEENYVEGIFSATLCN